MRGLTLREYEILTFSMAPPGHHHDLHEEDKPVMIGLRERGLVTIEIFEETLDEEECETWRADATSLGRLALRLHAPK